MMLAIGTKMFSASIDHIQTYTPEYLGNQAQNGMINRASVYYNPAGLVRLENGTYLQIGTQLALGYEKMEFNGKDYKADLLQPIPNFAMYNVKDNSALYWTFGGVGGGGDLEYKDGVAGTAVVPQILGGIINSNPMVPSMLKPLTATINTDGSKAEGRNIYAQTTVGKTWAIDDKLSVSLGGRVVYGIRNLKGDLVLNGNQNLKLIGIPVGESASIDSRRDAFGFGGQLGVNYVANEKLNLAMRYDTRVKMSFKARGQESKLNLLGQELGFSTFYPEYAIGSKVRRDLPAILAVGASYKVTDNWKLALAGNYYFNKDAKLDVVEGGNSLSKLGVKKVEPEYENGWEIALGNEYKLNERWTLLGSVNYAKTGAKASSYDDVEYALDSVTLGAGLKYMPEESTEWVFSVCHFMYDTSEGHYKEKYSGMGIDNPKYKKDITALGVSYTKKF